MKISDLSKRSAVRSSAILTTLFALILLGLYFGLNFYLSTELRTRINSRVLETRDTLGVIDAKAGFDELSTTVQDEADSVNTSGNIFLLLDENGAFEAGNVKDIEVFKGWRVLKPGDVHLLYGRHDPADRYIALWTKMSKGQLLIGASDHEIRATQSILRKALEGGLGVALLLALGSGYFQARRTQRRLDVLSDTLTSVSRGKIEVRVPLSGTDDDIDQIADQINATLTNLQRLVENVNQSSSDIAHDLKKPLGRLHSLFETTLKGATTVDEYRRVITSAQAEIGAIVATFEALLRISQIEAGARRSAFSEIDLKSVVENVIEIYEAVIEDTEHRFETNISKEPPAMILGDRELLVQLFANLIENAILYCPAGSIIRMNFETTPENFLIIVSDTGPGIPETERKNVFRRLYRLEKSRTTDGSGLGLSLVAAIVELHGATIELADAEPGLRATVAFRKRGA